MTLTITSVRHTYLYHIRVITTFRHALRDAAAYLPFTGSDRGLFLWDYLHAAGTCLTRFAQ